MSQRILSCFIIIFLVKLNLIIKMGMFALIQASTSLFLLVIRPYELTKDLLSELVGQLIMTFFSWIMVYFNSEHNWNNTINWVLIGSVMMSSWISTLIAAVDFIIQVIRKIKRRCLSNTSRVEDIRSNINMIQVVNVQKKKIIL